MFFRYFSCFSFMIVACQAQVLNVTPHVDCDQSSFGLAAFGYSNINAQALTIPVGINNFFLQFPLDQNQPTVFETGDHFNVFVDEFNPSEGFTWSLDSSYADASSLSSSLPICPAAFIDPQFAPIGVVSGQTLRIKAVAYSGNCDLELGVANGPVKSVSLAYGQVGFLDVTADTLTTTGRNGARKEFLPIAHATTGDLRSCQVSAEVYNSQLGMTVTSEKPQMPQYQPIFDSQAVVTGETLRIGVAAPLGFQCGGTASFQDGNGNLLGPSQLLNVASGSMEYFDLPSHKISALKAGAGSRVEVVPLFTVTPPVINTPNVSVCLLSVQTFDSLSGDTRTIVTPQPLP